MYERVGTDKGFVPNLMIMTPEMWQQIAKHYRKAVDRHPYFADVTEEECVEKWNRRAE